MKKIVIAILLSFGGLFIYANGQDDNGKAKSELNKLNQDVVKLFQQKSYDEAIVLAQKAVAMAEQIFGKEDLETAKSLRNLGFIQYVKKDSKSAEETLEKSYKIFKEGVNLNKNDAAYLAEMLEILGDIKYQNSKNSAEEIYEQALLWREKTESQNSLKLAKSLRALSSIAFGNKDYKKSALLSGRLLDIVFANFENYKEDSALIYYRTECAYRKLEKEKDFEAIKQKYSKEIEEIDAVRLFNESKNRQPRILNVGDVNGKAVYLPPPRFPLLARLNGLGETKVKVQVLIDENGSIIHACAVNKGNPILIEPSEAAAYKSRFSPTIYEGKAIRVSGIITYTYKRN